MKKEILESRQDMIDGKIGRLDLAIGMLLNFNLEGINYVNIGSSYYAIVDGKPQRLVQSDLLLFFKNISSLVEITGEGRDLLYPKYYLQKIYKVGYNFFFKEADCYKIIAHYQKKKDAEAFMIKEEKEYGNDKRDLENKREYFIDEIEVN